MPAQVIQFNRPLMKDEEARPHPSEAGFIKLYRTLQDCPFAGRPEYMASWVHILMLASHKPRRTMVGNKPVSLQTGQFVSGRKALAERVGITEKQMRTILDFFVAEGMISKSSDRSGTVFTVCNYSNFQENKGQGGPTVLGQGRGQGRGQAKPSNDAACSETEAKERAKERANAGPTKRATTQEHNKSISNEIDNIYGSSDADSPSRKPTPKKTTLTYPDEFEWIWANRPRREGADPKRKALQACNARIKQGASWRELAEGVKRYREFCEAKGISNTEFVKQMASFFGPDEHFRNAWTVSTVQRPASTHSGTRSGPDWDDLTWANDLGGL